MAAAGGRDLADLLRMTEVWHHYCSPPPLGAAVMKGGCRYDGEREIKRRKNTPEGPPKEAPWIVGGSEATFHCSQPIARILKFSKSQPLVPKGRMCPTNACPPPRAPPGGVGGVGGVGGAVRHTNTNPHPFNRAH